MPKKTLDAYRSIFGDNENPNMLVFDRGGWSKQNVQMLRDEGVKKVGIQPKGRASWPVGKRDRRRVMSERAKIEGTIGNLKSKKYGFNKPLARRSGSLRAAGQRSVCSFNLNKLMRDFLASKMIPITK